MNQNDDESKLTGLRVLLAEDYWVNQKVAVKMLAKMGIEPVVVEDGGAAAEAASKEAFHVILMDCQMPVLDGFAATRKIREDEAMAGKPSVPIIAMTAYSSGSEEDEARDAGMTGWIEKPIMFATFRQQILDACEATP